MPARPDQDPPDGHVLVGRVTSPWGLRGDLKVQPHTDLPERFAPGAVLHLDGVPTLVTASRSHRVGLVVRLESVPDRSAAEALRGALLTIPEETLPELADGAFYHFQLIEMDVYSDEDEYLGQVAEILQTPGNDVYIVRKEGTRDLLLPAISDVVQDIDLDANRMTVHMLTGLR